MGVSARPSQTPGSLQPVLPQPTVSLDCQEEPGLACPAFHATLENTSNTGKSQNVIKNVLDNCTWHWSPWTGSFVYGCLSLFVSVRKLPLQLTYT